MILPSSAKCPSLIRLRIGQFEPGVGARLLFPAIRECMVKQAPQVSEYIKSSTDSVPYDYERFSFEGWRKSERLHW